MAKEKGDYKPSPWLKEDLQADQVRVPPAIVSAIYQLQHDLQEVEYGGAIDFELISGQPGVERVLTYTGVVGEVPRDTWQKIFRNPDIELTFHTHPKTDLAIPSDGDIIFFLGTDPGAMLIFAGVEAILMTKGENTPPSDFARRHMKDYAGVVARPVTKGVPAPEWQVLVREELKKELDIDTAVFPYAKPLDISVKIVQDVAREGQRLQIFSQE